MRVLALSFSSNSGGTTSGYRWSEEFLATVSLTGGVDPFRRDNQLERHAYRRNRHNPTPTQTITTNPQELKTNPRNLPSGYSGSAKRKNTVMMNPHDAAHSLTNCTWWKSGSLAPSSCFLLLVGFGVFRTCTLPSSSRVREKAAPGLGLRWLVEVGAFASMCSLFRC